jgi:hypothetical protein
MAIKGILGALSPLYGAISGEGLMGKLLNPDKAAAIAKKAQDKEDEEKAQRQAERMQSRRAGPHNVMQRGGMQPGGMASGGKVKKTKAKSSASKRGDGVAQRGKTKGRMV